MAKVSGGTRNYRPGTSAHAKRYAEFKSLMDSGDYDKNRSVFYQGGGFVATHKDHNFDKKENDKSGADLSMDTAQKLARKGYRVYLDSEKSGTMELSTPDGKVEKIHMDIKTISTPGKWRMKKDIEDVAFQLSEKKGIKGAVIRQNSPLMTKDYVIDQIEKFKTRSPKRARDAIDWVIVVGSDGNVHRHKLK